MALGEKAVTGESQRYASNLIKTEKREEAEVCAFSEIVDKACEGLMTRQIKFTIRRIKEMEERLCVMEQELTAFLESRPRN